jgi:NADH-quinone oxidoreductase subunit G
MSVNVTINGKKYEAAEGALLIDVCIANGIHIPHFCYHPGLGPDGNCRMCQVDFVGPRGNKLGISCKTTVAEGMEVLTDSDAAKRARASVEEMLLLNHPLDCPICDKAGECTLQNYYMEHDLQPGRQDFTRFRKEKAKDIGPTLVLDQERCVLCDRCVRFLRDIAKEEQLYIAGRGHEAYITTFPGQEVTSPYSLNTVDLCPVGALTSKDFRFNSATWFLKSTNTTCITCARGCSMEIQTKKDQVYRMRPRPNLQVNGYWSCDEGRINYQFVNHDRVLTPHMRRGMDTLECSLVEAIAEMRSYFGFKPAGQIEKPSHRRVMVLASATCTLEELFLLNRLAKEALGTDVIVARHVPDGVDDHLLRRADKHPNARGAEMLGLRVVDLQRSNDFENQVSTDTVLFAVGFNTHVEAIAPLWTHAGKVIAISGCKSALTEAADLVIPGLTFAEKEGIVVNFEGQAQQLRTAIETKTVPEWKIIDAMISSLTGGTAYPSIAHLRQAIREASPAFADVDLLKLGLTGVSVPQVVAR